AAAAAEGQRGADAAHRAHRLRAEGRPRALDPGGIPSPLREACRPAHHPGGDLLLESARRGRRCSRSATVISSISRRKTWRSTLTAGTPLSEDCPTSMADILVVDDNRANREALASLLEVAGHSARRASSARQALESALAGPPDLVISDVLMPGMDGYVLVRELRGDPRTAALPVIFYTAYFAGQDAQDLAQAHGVARVLVKPSDNDLILRTVDEVLSETTHRPAAAGAELGGEHLRIVVDQLLEKTGTLEAQQRRIERLNRTLETMSAVNALIVRVGERADLLAEACRIAVERGGFGFAAIRLAHDERVVSSGEGSRNPRLEQFPVPPEAT